MKRLKDFAETIPATVFSSLALMLIVWPAATTAGGFWSYFAYVATAAVIYQWYRLFKSKAKTTPATTQPTETKE